MKSVSTGRTGKPCKSRSAVYIRTRLPDDSVVWGCRQCDWTRQACDEYTPEHRCGSGPCRHRGECVGEVLVQCCLTSTPKLQPAHKCHIHNRCITGFVPQGRDAVELWNSRKPESDIYTLCGLCDDFDTTEIV